MDQPRELEPAAPETTTHHQPEVSAELVAETKPGIGASGSSEAGRSVSFTTDDQPSAPRDKAQEDSAAPTEDTEDPLTAAQSKERKKKKRQSVSFAEPLEEHLGSATTGGEDDNHHQQKTKDSKDPISEIPTVLPQNGDSVDGRPAQSEAQSLSAQVGATVPLPDERDVRGADFDMQQQQEPTEPPASRSLERSERSETAGEEVAVGQEGRPSDESQPHAADESK
jgi:hypothetical protein